MLYLRFESAEADQQGRRAGIFGLANGLARSGALSAEDIELPPDDGLDLAYAPVWLFTALTGSAVGLPHPAGMEITSIQDAIGPNPHMYIGFTGLALGGVIAAAR